MDEYTNHERQRPVRSSGWVRLLRIVAVVNIVLGCLLSVILGLGVIAGSQTAGPLTTVSGLLVMAVGILLSFVGSASIMVFLDMATDVRAIRAGLERRR